MLGLPPSTEINKQLPKKAIFDKFIPNSADRKLFDDQISRLTIAAEISPQTVNVKPNTDVSAIFIILVTLKTLECDKKNIALLSKLIDQRMLFVLKSGEGARLAVFRAGKVLISENVPLADLKIPLIGLNLEDVWVNIIARVGCFDLTEDQDIDEIIIAHERKEKLNKQISLLEKKAKKERQPRRKWDIANEIKKLKTELEEISNG